MSPKVEATRRASSGRGSRGWHIGRVVQAALLRMRRRTPHHHHRGGLLLHPLLAALILAVDGAGRGRHDICVERRAGRRSWAESGVGGQQGAARRGHLALALLEGLLRVSEGLLRVLALDEAEQLERLWPLERAVADSLGYPGEEHRTPWEDTEVGLLCTMLREGCTGWKAEASDMYEGSKKKLRDGSTRLRFLTSKDGGVVFWLWVLGENMSGSDIVGYLREYLPVYYPFVHKTEQSVRVALAAYEWIQDTNRRKAVETLHWL